MANQMEAQNMPVKAAPKIVIVHNRFALGNSSWKFIGAGIVVFILTAICLAFCSPYLYLFVTSFKSAGQLSEPTTPLFPSDVATFNYQNQDLDLYYVPINGARQVLALYKPGRTSATFIDPQHPDAPPIEWEGRTRTLDKVFIPAWHPENYTTAIQSIDFLRLLLNTLVVAIIGALGAVSSAALVAYGFTRFRVPFGGVLFTLVMSTIILPPQVTIIPTFIFFQRIGWTGTLLPLIIPHFFGNAYNIFLLRQYFMGMPYELDEAAKVDGASPWQVFTRIILPNSRLALASVFMLHFLFAWNDFYNPLIFLSGNENSYVISLGLQKFLQLHNGQPNLLSSVSLLAMLLPLIMFFLAQKTFMQGIVLTGVEK
jgi:multiple sugar transport system permease protein